MRFWDTSALFALVVPQRETSRVRRWIAEDSGVLVWALTRVELLSAVSRRRRELPSAADRLVRARREFLDAWERWAEISAIDLVRAHAERVVERHPLRAADALHIEAALVACDGDPGFSPVRHARRGPGRGRGAGGEGFPVLGP